MLHIYPLSPVSGLLLQCQIHEGKAMNAVAITVLVVIFIVLKLIDNVDVRVSPIVHCS